MFFSFWPRLVQRQDTHAGILCHFSLFFFLSVNMLHISRQEFRFITESMSLEITTHIIIQLLFIFLYLLQLNLLFKHVAVFVFYKYFFFHILAHE